MGSAVLVGVLCTAVLFGLSVARGTAPMAGVAHSERGPSSAWASTSTTAASPSPSVDPEPSDVVLAPRGSSRGPGGPAAAPVQVPATPAVAAPAERVVAPEATDDPPEVAVGVVRQGAYCKRGAVGQTGYTSRGTEMICEYGDGEGQPRWRATGPEPGEASNAEPPNVEPTAVGPTTKPPATQSADQPSESTVQANEAPNRS
jgi:hypothetical protein